ncbi:MAG: hypothetical protein JO213_17840, partial [Alphaproteobacteria bacterium]|nr:hypothetical protein [Alphaproteobacteria bacterium]
SAGSTLLVFALPRQQAPQAGAPLPAASGNVEPGVNTPPDTPTNPPANTPTNTPKEQGNAPSR